MRKGSLKKAPLRGIPTGAVAAVLLAVIRMPVNGGGFFRHRVPVYGILTRIRVPIAGRSTIWGKNRGQHRGAPSGPSGVFARRIGRRLSV